jgi:superfamily II DNA/RNA helicase
MPRAIILAPTREIALQISDNFALYGKYHTLKPTLIIGGMSPVEQERALNKPVDVLIATPGRLMDHMERGRILLNDIIMLVIDEADRMLDMGFIPDIEKIVQKLPASRQTLLFSATMPPAISKLAQKFLQNPAEVSVSSPKQTADTVKQFSVAVLGKYKDKALHALVKEQAIHSAIIFCNRKKNIVDVKQAMEKQGYKVGELHGDLTQPQRFATLEQFKADAIQFLVASDVAARGLDIDDLPVVINYDPPTNPDDYIHRIGRTGRAGKSGLTYMLFTEAERKYVDAIQEYTGGKIMPLQGNALTVEESPTPTPAPSTAKTTRTNKPVKPDKKPAKRVTEDAPDESWDENSLPDFLTKPLR